MIRYKLVNFERDRVRSSLVIAWESLSNLPRTSTFTARRIHALGLLSLMVLPHCRDRKQRSIARKRVIPHVPGYEILITSSNLDSPLTGSTVTKLLSKAMLNLQRTATFPVPPPTARSGQSVPRHEQKISSINYSADSGRHAPPHIIPRDVRWGQEVLNDMYRFASTEGGFILFRRHTPTNVWHIFPNPVNTLYDGDECPISGDLFQQSYFQQRQASKLVVF